MLQLSLMSINPGKWKELTNHLIQACHFAVEEPDIKYTKYWPSTQIVMENVLELIPATVLSTITYFYGLSCISSPTKSIYWSPTPNVTEFGDSACKEVSKVKWGQRVGVLIQQSCCPYKKRKRHQGMHVHREKDMWGHGKKTAICKSRREEASGENHPSRTWIFSLQNYEK